MELLRAVSTPSWGSQPAAQPVLVREDSASPHPDLPSPTSVGALSLSVLWSSYGRTWCRCGGASQRCDRRRCWQIWLSHDRICCVLHVRASSRAPLPHLVSRASTRRCPAPHGPAPSLLPGAPPCHGALLCQPADAELYWPSPCDILCRGSLCLYPPSACGGG
jgi:hypothetical protein